jgi:UDPglucose--hexose-1-phosphate uridylyltransferase
MSGPSEVRLDPWSGAEVIVAPGRLTIGATKAGGLPEPSGRCPFCPGHEADTEVTVAGAGDPWQTRVVGNRFPIVAPSMPSARGVHEVVIETRAHDVDLPDLDDAAIARIVGLLRERARVLACVDGVKAIAIYRNRGRRAGSSQPHPHTQIAALSYVPPETRRRDARALADPGLLGRALDAERTGGRIVSELDGFATFCPYASSRAHEVRIVPTGRVARLAHLDEAGVAALAKHLGRVLRALRERMGLSDYNVLVRDPALETRGTFFSVDILPRTGGDAGFELLTGSSICLVAPEETAAALRAISDTELSRAKG